MPPRGGAGVAWMRGRNLGDCVWGPCGRPWGMEGPTLHEARRAATRAPTPHHAAPAPTRCLSPWQKPTLESPHKGGHYILWGSGPPKNEPHPLCLLKYPFSRLSVTIGRSIT